MTLSVSRIQHYLKSFKLEKLFIEELGWNRHSGKLSIEMDGIAYTLSAVAEKRGVQIFSCLQDVGGKIPDYATRRRIEKQVTKSAYEHLIIFIDDARSMQIWQWVSRQPGLRAAFREHHYLVAHHSGESLIQKLESITFSLSEEEGLALTGVAFKLRDAFDRDKITKKFYDHFKKQQGAFLDFIKGIIENGDRAWYASLMLNRLMFVYFIQKKGFLDQDIDYLRNRLKRVQASKGKGVFLSFYRYFLLRLFHEGFSQQVKQREKDLEALLGKVPYLNGGLFELHELERKYPEIDIPDEAFEKLFTFFDQYEWHLDNRPLSNDNEINPDVLGYIFEKYINQKQMGAYYTKEDITEYISKSTVIPYLFNAALKKCTVAFQPDASLWRLLRNTPLRYIYPAMSKGVIDTNGEVIPLPGEIAKGIDDVANRGGWNKSADAEYSLPTETWREHVARRQRCLDIIDKLTKGELCQINDLITYNLDIRQFAEDAIIECEGPELLRSFYQAISTVTVLDPTCGSGAFLFAALNILEPLYDACLDRMQGFVDDMARSGERHRPEKFSDFRRILKEIDRHPNRRFFVFKSIVVNNLYGVDIMEEAVEICKLRLFLKLVAQVDKARQLEPLPDIDFNIRSGNTLVGFVSVDEIRKAASIRSDGQQQILFRGTKDEITQIEEDAGVVELAFKRFHEMQAEHEMDARDFKTAKKDLCERLEKLSGKLDQYLAKEYGIDLKKKKAFEVWRSSHQPFHWFIEFYGIMNRGGFDVIIGNPPYVEYSKIRKHYKIIKFVTETCGNLYAFTIENSFKMMARNGLLGLIVPLSIATTDRMRPIQKLLLESRECLWLSYYDVYPSKLFDGAKQRLTILIFNKTKNKNIIYTTKYHRWRPQERESLFNTLQYHRGCYDRSNSSIPKINGKMDLSILQKLKNMREVEVISDRTNPAFFVHRIPYNFIKAIDFIPYFWNEVDGEKKSEDYKPYRALAEKDNIPLLAALNSNLFFWWWYSHFEGYHCGKHEISAFPIGLNKLSNNNKLKLTKLAKELMEDLKKNKNRKICNYKTTGKVIYDEFFPKHSKYIIDQIDKIIGDHLGLDSNEIDHILNYDIKFRNQS